VFLSARTDTISFWKYWLLIYAPHCTVVTNKTNKNKKKLIYDLKVREALEIRRHNSGPGSGLNEDFGAYVKTTMWDPVFHKMRNEDERREGANPLLGSCLFLLFSLFSPSSSSYFFPSVSLFSCLIPFPDDESSTWFENLEKTSVFLMHWFTHNQI